VNPQKIRVEKKIGNGVLSFETGQLAKQAAACVIVQYGETVVITAVASGSPRPGIDFFPADLRLSRATRGRR
jgi:polyribonucleotide nucleotidyltransferase